MLSNFEEAINILKKEYENLDNQNDKLRERLLSFNQEEEIKKANDRANYYRDHALLILSDQEKAAQKDFILRHFENCALPLHNKTKGNTYIYTITGTGFGSIIEITCPICGATKDITDTDSW